MKRLIKYAFYILLTLVFCVNIFILLSGRFYLYSGISKTYLIGKTGPGIYDLDVFPVNTIEKSTEPNRLKVKPGDNLALTESEELYLRSLDTRALLIFENDTLLHEQYWGDHTENQVSNSFSVSKTVIGLLIGIAIEEGKIPSVDEPVSTYLPEFLTNGRDILTIRHLLLMAAGFDWQESGKNPLSEAAEGYYGSGLYGLVTRLRMVEEPGKRFHYQSGNSQILGFILEKATGLTLTEYMHTKLWEPIGAGGNAYWSLDKEEGDEKAFCCLYASARDFSLLGQLVLHNGKLNGEQIISNAFLKEMVKTPKLKTDDDVFNMRYGWHIWVYKNKGNPVYYFRGLKGQYIIVIPAQNRVIVRLGERRGPHYKIPSTHVNDSSFRLQNDEKLGHTVDLFEYLKIADRIVAERI